MYVCQSVSWLTFLLELGQYRYISCTGWDILLKKFGGFPGMILLLILIIPNFLYVGQSVSWLTLLLKLGQYRYISCTRWDIFLKIFGGFPGINLHHFHIILNFLYVCQSVSWLTLLLKLGQYRYISFTGWDIFLKIVEGSPGINLQLIQIILNFLYVCQSVNWLTSLLKLG